MKYTSHRRYREPAVTEAPKKVKLKFKPAPRPKDVARARNDINEALEKHSTRHYRRHRDKVDRIVSEVLEKRKLKKTSSEHYWRLAFVCALIGS